MDNTGFVHIRHRDIKGNIKSKGGATIYYEIDEEDDGVDLEVLLSVSRCSPKDNFVKRLGRDKAQGRFHAKDGVNIHSLSVGSVDGIAAKIIDWYYNQYLPTLFNSFT